MSGNLKVAVVDDDKEVGRLVKDLLQEEGYEVTQFLSPTEALIDFQVNLPHILITDYRMNDIDGLEFLKKTHQMYPEIVSIMMTGCGSSGLAEMAIKAGAISYIDKPFKNEELILSLRKISENLKLPTNSLQNQVY